MTLSSQHDHPIPPPPGAAEEGPAATWRALLPVVLFAAAFVATCVLVLRDAGFPFRLWPLGQGEIMGVLFGTCLVGGVLCVFAGQLTVDLVRRLRGEEPPPLAQRIRSLRQLVVACLVLVAVYTLVLIAYVNLKPALPLLNPTLHDASLEALERALFGGILPSEWLIAHSGPLAVRFWNTIYDLFSLFVFLSLAIALATRGMRAGAHLTLCLLVGLALDIAITAAYPTRGPIFEHPEWFGAIEELSSGQLARFLVHSVDAYQRQPGAVYACGGISAMPSYHVFGWTCALLFWRPLPRWLLSVGVLLTALNWISTVVLGWHYVLDGLIGVLLAIGVWWVTRPLFVHRAAHTDERRRTP